LTDSGFASFFRQRFSRTVVLLLAMGASRADAEDATQEAMILAWQQWESLDNPAAWVRTVAVRTFWRRARALGLQEVVTDRGTAAEQSAVDVDLAVFTEEQQGILRRLRGLPRAQRTVFALYYDGLSCEEIATLLDKTPATVRSNLRYARQALREVTVSELWRIPQR
jgi:RNA polymerase sigma factor (sigma-70 family)